MGFSKIAYSGTFWTTLLRGSVRVLNILRIAVLARILTPAQFGAFGIATMSLNFLEIVTETGINSILLQEEGKIGKFINTAWVVSIVRGFAMGGLIVVTAPLIAQFFNSPQSLNLLYLSATIPIIRGFINPSIIRFQKELKFDKEFYLRFSLVLIETIVIILWALSTLTADSLLWGMIISAIAEVVFSFVFISPRPRLHIEPILLKTILNRGRWITGYGILEYIYSNADNIFVGRILGQSALGIYQNAYKLSLSPLTELSTIFYKVTFPLFAQMSSFPQRLKTAAIKSAFLLVGLMFVSSISILLLAEPLVLVLLGPTWIEAVPIVRVLSFLSLIRGINFSFNSLIMAVKKQEYITIITFVSALGLLATLVPFISNYGTIGAGYAAIFGAVITIPVSFYYIHKTLVRLDR